MNTKGFLTLATYMLVTGMLVASFNINAKNDAALQCIEAPQRDSPCPNLIYSSFKNNSSNRLFCLCKNDKSKLLQLLGHNGAATQTKTIRQFVSLHRFTQPELISLLQGIPD